MASKSKTAGGVEPVDRRWDWRNPGNLAARRQLVAAVRSAARDQLEGAGLILEIGFGSGWLLRELAEDHVVNRLYGVDRDARRVAAVQAALPGASLHAADATALPFVDQRFSIVIIASVLSAMSADDARRVLVEASRVLEPRGALIVYEPRPTKLGVRGSRQVPAAEVADALARPVQTRALTVLPPLARRLTFATWALYPLLTMLRPLRTHAIHVMGGDRPRLTTWQRPGFRQVLEPGLTGARAALVRARGTIAALPRRARNLHRSRPARPASWLRPLALPERGLARPHVWMLVRNDCTTDRRVLREATALAEAGWGVTIFATLRGRIPEREIRDGVEIVRVPIMPWHYRALRRYRLIPKWVTIRTRLRRRWRWTASWLRSGDRIPRAQRLVPAPLATTWARLPHPPGILRVGVSVAPKTAWPIPLARLAHAARSAALQTERDRTEALLGRPAQHRARARRRARALGATAAVATAVRRLWAVVWWLGWFAGRSVVAAVLAPLHPRATARRVVRTIRPLGYEMLRRVLMRAHRQFVAYDYLRRVTNIMRERLEFMDEHGMPHTNVVHAHDLNTLPTGLVLRRLTRGSLVYDSHELHFGTVRASEHPRWKRGALRRYEGLLARRVDATITVNESLSTILAATHRIPRPVVLRNCPELMEDPPRPKHVLRDALDIPTDRKIALYHGNIASYRGLDELIAAAALLPEDIVVVVLGDGSARPRLQELASATGLSSRVRFHPNVPSTELRDVLAEVDIGVIPIRGFVANYYYSLPNKLFELMSAGRPVAAARLPEIRAVVERHDIGAIFDPDDPADIAAAIEMLMTAPDLHEKAARSAAAAEVHNWQAERHKLLDLYAGFARPSGRRPERAPRIGAPS